ncbi:MAG: hypothetical protein Q4B52_00355 [Tissierellia bacterium]|nr:hypothetical protein [Tissierellia bacterium]
MSFNLFFCKHLHEPEVIEKEVKEEKDEAIVNDVNKLEETKEEKKDDKENEDYVVDVKKEEGYYKVDFKDGNQGRISLLEDNMFRYYIDPSGEFENTPNPPKAMQNQMIKHQMASGIRR